jgi:carbamoyl-phosphate synthase large subunit
LEALLRFAEWTLPAVGKLRVPNVERIFFIRHALRAGFTIDEIFSLTKIDRWFLVQIKEIVDFEEELATAKN